MTPPVPLAGLHEALRRRIPALLPRRRDLAAMLSTPRRDVVAGLTVAVVALPLALAFGISSGLGAQAGMVTAIVAGVLAAVFGGSSVQVSGPTGAMTVVLVPIVAAHGPGGVFAVGLLAGAFLVTLAAMGAGRLMDYVPLPVIEGFTVGIAVIIGLQQVPAALGVAPQGHAVLPTAVRALGEWLSAANWWATPHLAPVLVAATVAAAMLLASRFWPGSPMSLAAVVVATALASLLDLPLRTIGTMPAGLPGLHLPRLPLDQLGSLVVPALAVAALAAMESLLSATVADGMRVGERHDSDRELFGQGVANLVVPLFGGVPATAAIARTAVNVRSGAQSRLAAVVHSLALLLVVLVASRWVGHIPLAALAGVLIATAIRMVEVSGLVALLRSTRSDALVLAVTTIATVALDLVTAVIIGLVVACVLALRQVAGSARLTVTQLDDDPATRADVSRQERELLDEQIVAYRLDGPLFFAAAHSFLLELSELSHVRVVILRMSKVAALDATGAAVLGDAIKRLEERGITVLLSGIRPGHDNVLQQLGVYEQIAHERHVFTTTPEAIAHARMHVARIVHTG